MEKKMIAGMNYHGAVSIETPSMIKEVNRMIRAAAEEGEAIVFVPMEFGDKVSGTHFMVYSHAKKLRDF